ncbi:tRNA pseudouridine(38-40) synthase TruA [Methylococcus geothermalis]|uniref:tRNA pseudouridine synthase A n=1 Tax=Methylococcus geothermalis TaxID=2681310 RepID=A0A858Q6W8_9GAMM|nr:tRNA pseudouridine(38-40) synthase TruA [Methylococcus geothermalis]QJD29456.1 tRNA pseudouridine(38-40) synthase TruA [Methylococcus geothermalis]
MRIALGIEYDGSGFAGWQRQSGKRTIQSVVEQALSRVADAPIRVVCAGRTDAGVHAIEQVVHFDTESRRSERSWLLGANTALPDDVRILWVREIEPRFHARLSAIARYYRYEILNRPMRSALRPRQLTWCHAPLDVERMREGAVHLIGEHDFSSFRAQQCQSRSPFRRVHFLHVRREGERVVMEIAANAFVHHMVRNIAGVLMAVGAGKHDPAWVGELLSMRDRAQGGVTAPPDGLYLGGVCYPEEFGLARDTVFEHLPADARRYEPDDES